MKEKTIASKRIFMNVQYKSCRVKTIKLLSEYGKIIGHTLLGLYERKRSGNHDCDTQCRVLGIKTQLILVSIFNTSGMIKYFSGHIGEPLKAKHFHWAIECSKTRCVALYNHELTKSTFKEYSIPSLATLEPHCATTDL